MQSPHTSTLLKRVAPSSVKDRYGLKDASVGSEGF